MHKINKIAKQSRKARVLFSGSAFSANTWGHQPVALPLSVFSSLELNAGKATGILNAGRCRFAALVVAFGPRGHPIARISKELFTSWFQLLQDFLCSEFSVALVSSAWNIAKVKFSKPCTPLGSKPIKNSNSPVGLKKIPYVLSMVLCIMS